jgi:hypothetical protein
MVGVENLILKICTAPGTLVPLFAEYAGIAIGQLTGLTHVEKRTKDAIVAALAALDAICDEDGTTWESFYTDLTDGLGTFGTLSVPEKGALVETWNYVYAQSNSCGVYRSSSMGFTFRDPGGKHKVQVGIYLDMTLENGLPESHVAGEPHRLRLGSLDVPTCPTGSGEHCKCPTGVGRDDVELRGVLCTAKSDVSAAANKGYVTTYVDEAVECAVRGMPSASNRNIYTVVDASEFKVGTGTAAVSSTDDRAAHAATKNTISITGVVAEIAAGIWSITTPVMVVVPAPSKDLVTPFLVRVFRKDKSPDVYSVQDAHDSTDVAKKWVVQLHDGSVPVVDGLFRVDDSLVVDKCGVLSVAKDVKHETVTTSAVTFVDKGDKGAGGCEMGNTIKSEKEDGCRATLLIDAKQLCITCNVSQSSDERLKRDIHTIPNALAMCRAMRGVEFKWTDERVRGGYQMGVIAQEVERVYPSLVDRSDGGFLGVDYAKLVGMLIEAVKELDGEVARLRELIGE